MSEPFYDSTRPPTPTLAHDVPIDVATLLRTKMLLTASSGGGKSWGVRRILEQTFGHAQHIVLDRDGEFHTLRERFDYGLLGEGGEGAVTVESAPMAARRLLELGVSAIVDLSSLRGDKELWVKGFVEELNNAPRSLWHSLLVVLDEAHKYAPEKGAGEAPSTEAIKELCTDGRKKGYCLIACTQRVAELHKSVVAELQNKMIGLTTMDLDVQRAARQLGMKPSTAVEALSYLEPGQFHIVGPALSKRVQLIRVGPVQTTHPEPGQGAMPPTPPRSTIKAVLGKLSEIAPAAKEEVRTIEQLRARVRELEARSAGPDVDHDRMADQVMRLKTDLAAAQRVNNDLAIKLKTANGFERIHGELLDKIANRLDAVITSATDLRNLIPDTLQDAYEAAELDDVMTSDALVQMLNTDVAHAQAGVPLVLPVRENPLAKARIEAPSSSLSSMERAFLTVLAQRGPQPQRRILLYAAYARSGSTDKAFASLVAKDLARREADRLTITTAGVSALGEVPRLVDRSLKIDEMPKNILTVIAQCGPVTQRTALLLAGYARSGSTDKAFALLAKNEWIGREDGKLTITSFGSEALGPYEAMTRRQLVARAVSRLDAAPRRLWDQIANFVSDRRTILANAGYKRSGNTDKAFAFLISRGFVIKDGERLVVAPELI